jgi:uncharacterized protein YdaU (DUF1376 family)
MTDNRTTKNHWMPLHIGDYLRETRHLTAEQHGGYLLLLMEYWTKGCLPDDDALLARIASMTPKQWRRSRPTIQSLFSDGWKHHRLDPEIARVADVAATNAERARKAAKTRWSAAKSATNGTSDVCSEHATSIAQAMLGDAKPQPQPESLPSGEVAPAAPQPTEAVKSKSKKKGKPSTPATVIAADWTASEADRAYARDQGLDNAQIGFQEKSFKEHWRNPDTKAAEKSDWSATWRKWILRSIGYAKGVSNLPRDLATARVNKPAAKPVIYVIKDTKQGKAWKAYYNATRGVDPPETDIKPNGKYGRIERGWDGFESEYPPPLPEPAKQAAA